MKKKYIILSIITLVLLITFVTSFNYFKTTNNYVEDSVNNQTKITKGISMNLEQTAGAGDYKTVTQSKWPTEGYKFNSELSRCENGSKISWDDTKKAVIVLGNLSDKCYVYFDKLLVLSEVCGDKTLKDCVIAQYTGTQGQNNIYYHKSSLSNGAGDNSYRYAGASDQVNNFVCFGSTTNPCPIDNLYRIIGVIDGKVKLIKYDYANRNLLGTTGEFSYHNSPPSKYQGALTDIDIYHLNSSPSTNDWSVSQLNKTNLNTSFINNIGTTWASKIITTTWKVGGGSWANIGTSVPKTAYQYEVGSSASSTTYDAKIGLMYVSDYYYAAGPSAWTLVGYNSSDSTKDYRIAITINWMYMGFDDWTLTPYTDDSEMMFGIHRDGNVTNSFVGMDSYGVRPVFNLDTSVTYVSGDGTKSLPIIIN